MPISREHLDDGRLGAGPCGSAPADRASWRPPAARRKSRSAMTLRPLFPTQTKRTLLMRDRKRS